MLVALLILASCIILGTIVHELSHAVALKMFGIPHEMQWFPDRSPTDSLPGGLLGRWAAVTYDATGTDFTPWQLRLSALMPLSLAVPFVLVVAGIVPDPMQFGNLYVSLAIIGWLACAIPSPADFSIVWHPEESLASSVEAAEHDIESS